MSLPPRITSALHKIAELAGSGESSANKMERILGTLRLDLGLDSISVVAANTAPDEPALWYSSDDSYTLDTTRVKQFAFGIGQQDDTYKLIPLPATNGCKSVMVLIGEYDAEEHAILLEVAASYLSIIVQNADLHEKLEQTRLTASQRFAEVAAIYEVGLAMEESDLNAVFEAIVEKAAPVMDAQACSIMLSSPADQTLEIKASRGLSEDIVKGTHIRFGEGIAGKVAATGEPMMITDVWEDPRFHHEVKQRSGISGSMCVPLKEADGIVCGVLNIRRHEPKPGFNEDEFRLFQVFAQHAEMALSNARLYTNLHKKVAEMEGISEVLRTINSTLDTERVLNQIVESLMKVVDIDRCCVYLLDSRTDEFVASAHKGYPIDEPLVNRIKRGEGVIGLAAQELIPIFSQCSTCEGDNSGEFLAAPIIVKDQAIGVVTVDNCNGRKQLAHSDIDLLSTFVSQVGVAVENARLYEAMEEKYAELNVLYEHSRNLSTAYGLEETSSILVQTASKAVRSDGAELILFDTRRESLTLQAAGNNSPEQVSKLSDVISSRSATEFVRELKAPVLISTTNFERTSGPNSKLLNALAPDGAELLLAPLVAEDSCIGLLAIHRRSPDEFQASEFKLISIIASHSATVIKNAVLYEQKMQQRVLELTALYEFSKKISSASNLEEALDSILAIVADLVGYDESFIYGIDQEKSVAAVKAARFRGDRCDFPPDEPLDGSCVVSWAIRERKAVVSPDVSRDPRFSETWMGHPGIKSLMAIPLIVQDEVVGVLSVHCLDPNMYSDDDVQVLSIIASQGAAIYKELEALTALTSYTDNILSSIAAGVATLDSSGYVLTWNTAAEKIVGVDSPDIVGLHYERVLKLLTLPTPDKDTLRRAVDHVYSTGDTHTAYKIAFHPENQDIRYMNLSISQLLNSTGEQLGLVVIFEDITREIKMEDEFRRMGELAAVGQLAASIAHELRNPLSSIKGAAQFLQKEFEHESSIVEFLGIIIEEVNGLNKLTTEFLDFARPMQLELKPTSINRIVERTLQLMSVHITDHNTAVKESLHPQVPEIQADEHQLDQVMKNIILNALQAMPEGGVLTIETGPTASEGAYISISDSGIGIPPDKTERIFQPFFTTKTKGTGLGLSVVHKIVENHGGRIELVSEVGKGSTFKIILPRMGSYSTFPLDHDSTMERRESGGRT